MNEKKSVINITIDGKTSYSQDSPEGKELAMLAKWVWLFPHTTFSYTAVNNVFEHAKTQFKDSIPKLDSSNFQNCLIVNHFLEYNNELRRLYELMPASGPEAHVWINKAGIEYFLKTTALQFYKNLQDRYPILKEFATITTAKLESDLDKFIAPYLCLSELNENMVAIKHLPITTDNEAGLVEYLARSRSFSHEAILPIKQVFADCVLIHNVPHTFLCLTTDLADDLADRTIYKSASIKNIVENGGRIEIYEIIAILSPIVDALQYLNRAGFQHNNLTWDNILFFKDQPRLTDATLHFREQQERHSILPPEQVPRNSDIPGFGLILYSMVSGLAPEQYPQMPIDAMRQPLWKTVNSFVLRCCSPTNKTRFTFEEFVAAWEELKCRIL